MAVSTRNSAIHRAAPAREPDVVVRPDGTEFGSHQRFNLGEVRRATTTALFVWPRPVAPPGTHPGLSRMAGESEPKSVFSGALQRGYGDDPTFGWSELYGTEAERSMVLTATVRAKLKALPRRLAEVRFHPDALKIIWKGVDESPAIFEESFKIGIACLESLAPRSR